MSADQNRCIGPRRRRLVMAHSDHGSCPERLSRPRSPRGFACSPSGLICRRIVQPSRRGAIMTPDVKQCLESFAKRKTSQGGLKPKWRRSHGGQRIAARVQSRFANPNQGENSRWSSTLHPAMISTMLSLSAASHALIVAPALRPAAISMRTRAAVMSAVNDVDEVPQHSALPSHHALIGRAPRTLP